MTLSVFPSPENSPSIVDPINTVFATHELLEHADTSMAYDNQALIDICNRNYDTDIPYKNYHQINSIVAHCAASLTSSMRLGGHLHTNLAEIQECMVPYPRIHLLNSVWAPFYPSNTPYPHDDDPFSTYNISLATFDPSI
jgi:hypothetical protein